MSKTFFNIKNGANIGNLSTDPSDGRDGDTYYNTTSNTVREYVNGGWTDAVQTTTTQTLTNKTIDGPSNTLTNIATSSLAAIPADTMIGNNTGSSATPTNLTVTQINTMLGTLANPATAAFDTLYQNSSNTTLVPLHNGTTGQSLIATTSAAPSWGYPVNIAGGLGGSIPYQTAVNTTAMLANGSAGQVLTSNGGTSAPSWSTTTAPTFSLAVNGSLSGGFSGSTYTVPARCIAIKVTAIGGGGGGGSTLNLSANAAAASGGGAGGTGISLITVTPGQTFSFAVGIGGAGGVASGGGTVANAGAGGNPSSFGSITAGAGAGGSAGAAVNGLSFNVFAAAGGGVATGANILNAQGGSGDSGITLNDSQARGGRGGSPATLGTGGDGIAGSNQPGEAGRGYGSGGGGATGVASSAAQSGGAGANGVILVEEFYE